MESDKHESLAKIIKGVHQQLRKEVHLSHNPNKVWDDHLKNKDAREKYALAMHKLATEVWKYDKESRIWWSYETCLNYFYKGGLERSLIRQMKLRKISLQKQNLKSEELPEDISITLQHNYKTINRKLNLLDVGSCYNPFSDFKEFKCTAIDLTPATEDVLQHDFLSVKINPKEQENFINDTSIFVEESFDIVVLSLVLEYLPASEQRAVFCYKSWQLLQENGLCIIITPDSKSVNHNAQMMKSWKLAMEEIGFIRIKYDKLRHIHCMAFRKLKKENRTIHWETVSKNLYIPQDFMTYTDSENTAERTSEEDIDICSNFLELPFDNVV